MAYPTYLVHFNPNHDPKNGKFTFKKLGSIFTTRNNKKDRSGDDFDGVYTKTAPASTEKKGPESFKSAELDNDYKKVKANQIPNFQHDLKWLRDDDDANKVWGKEYVKMADIGLKALDKIGRQAYNDDSVGATNSDRSWFVFEDQTIGMPSIAYLASTGKSADEIASIVNSNYRCARANNKYMGQYDWLKNREEYEEADKNIPYRDVNWELREYAGWGEVKSDDEYINECVKAAKEYDSVKHAIAYGDNYLIHYNENHSKANGRSDNMYKAVLKHGDVTYSSNSRGNQAHDKATGKFTFNPNKAANVSRAISTGARNASQNIANNSNSYLRGKKGPRADLSNMSDQELQRIINRENMERQYDNYFNTPTESKGKKFVDGLSTVLGITATAAGIAASGFAIYAAVKGKK